MDEISNGEEGRIEILLKGRGYKLIDEQPPFRIYEKHKKRIVYHVPSCKVWGHFRMGYFEEAKDDE